MELAGLEPATSWVRFPREPSPLVPSFAIRLNLRWPLPDASPSFAAFCHRYLTKT